MRYLNLYLSGIITRIFACMCGYVELPGIKKDATIKNHSELVRQNMANASMIESRRDPAGRRDSRIIARHKCAGDPEVSLPRVRAFLKHYQLAKRTHDLGEPGHHSSRLVAQKYTVTNRHAICVPKSPMSLQLVWLSKSGRPADLVSHVL